MLWATRRRGLAATRGPQDPTAVSRAIIVRATEAHHPVAVIQRCHVVLYRGGF